MNSNFLKEIGIKNIDFSKAKIPTIRNLNAQSKIEDKVFGIFSYIAIEHNKVNRVNYAD